MMAFQDQPYDYVRRSPPAHDDERTGTPSRDDTDDVWPRRDMRRWEEVITLRMRMMFTTCRETIQRGHGPNHNYERMRTPSRED